MSTNVGAAPTTLPGTNTTAKHAEQPEVLIEADKALDEFKRLMEMEYYPKASALHERAKILFEQVKLHWTEGKHKVLNEHGKWSAEDFDADMIKLLKKQEASWDKLEQLVAAERDKMNATYQKVLLAKAAVDRERGAVNHTPVVCMFLDSATREQHTILNVYQKKLRGAFQDAAQEYVALEGYPDGLLTQVRVMRKHAVEETARLVEWLTKKDRRHHPHHHEEQEHAAALVPPTTE